MPQYKKCTKGHYYDQSLGSCPYCTKIDAVNNNSATCDPTDVEGQPTTIMDGPSIGNNGGQRPCRPDDPTIPNANPPYNESGTRTMFMDSMDENGKMKTRDYRMLVGWLVSYTLDSRGVDFKLFEGRNIIGQSAKCQITLQDSTVSGTHCVILFRAGKFSIKDEQSTHGTFVNGEDIELEPRYLNDGDIVTLGNTQLKFRVAL